MQGQIRREKREGSNDRDAENQHQQKKEGEKWASAADPGKWQPVHATVNYHCYHHHHQQLGK